MQRASRSCGEPAAHGDRRPNYLHESERPSSLKKTIDGSQSASCRKGQHEPAASVLQCIANQHRRDREQTESCKSIHSALRENWFGPVNTRAPGRWGDQREGCCASRSRFSSRTLIRGSPRKPNWRPSVWRLTNTRTSSSPIFRSRATRGT
jgi:hypothetical protein